MPKVTRSSEEIEEVKDQILDEALSILVMDGYDGLSMNRLGAGMNMTAANLYNYYGNKNELLIA
ncbi:MAG: TetR/AcrR family transcriptional regulator, partial [Desulfobacterota bacterium]|nr:TetR/AcrR family transcriptional regulator [Thermodesulfobacteriota bacterium]